MKESVDPGNNYLSSVLNNIGDPIFVKDDQSRLLTVNKAFCELFGLKRADIIGKTLAEDVSPGERESFLKIDKEVLSHGVESINEETLTVRDGQTLRISTRKTRFVDPKGKKFLVGVIHDITERYRTEQELKKAKEQAEDNEERFRNLIVNMEAGVVVHAPDTSIIQNNHRASQILGLSDDRLKGKTAMDPGWRFVYLDKTPLPLAEYPVNRIATTKKPIKNQQAGIFHPETNKYTWLTVNGFPVMDSNGDITEIVTIFIDITAQKQREEENLAGKLRLEETQKELNQAQKLARVGSWIYKPTTKELIWSDEMFQIWGFDPEKGTPSYDPDMINRIHPEDLELYDKSFSQAINPGTPCDVEFRLCFPKDEQKVVRSIFKPTFKENGEVESVSGTNQDITLQKVFEETQVKHQRLKAIGEMSSSIAHDFNNALQEMLGNLEIVKLQKDLSKDTIQRLNDIGSIISDTASRVSALQRFGDTENEDKNARPIDLNKLIEESLNQSRPLWKDNMEKDGLRINVETDFQEIPKIKCNSGELKSVIYNLVKNSVEAMPEGGDLIIKTGLKSDCVFATFTDTGTGMDSEAKLKVFEPFFTTKGFNLGRGLGMSGAYTIAKKHGGNIRVKASELHKGTTIELTFPISERKAKLVKKDVQPKIEKPLRVLWVDDDFIITKASRMMVESIGYSCTAVNSGIKALEYLSNNPCDMVFTDIGMPKMNGWELAEAIRNKYGKKIKIAAVTGWNMMEKVQDEDAFDFFLQKPFNLNDLKKVFVDASTHSK